MTESGTDRGRFIARLPKAELHVHLEGSMEPELLLELARRHGVSLPADDVAGVRRWFRFRDFEHFLGIYLACSRCLREPEDFARLLLDFARVQAAQNVLYCEAHFTISTHVANGADGDEVAHALGEALVTARERHGVIIGLIPDIVRNLGPSAADVTLEWALDHRSRGVVALGLAGLEGPPVAPFGRHFDAARAAGLRTTAHAGEQRGAESIREVLEVCQPDRIGHGIAAAADEALLGELVERALPLEVCPTSNVRLGYARRLAEHPFDALYRAGAAVTINSDDPPLFGTSLNGEFASLARVFDYTRGEIAAFARAAFLQAFIDEDLRRDLLARFDRDLEDLTREPC